MSTNTNAIKLFDMLDKIRDIIVTNIVDDKHKDIEMYIIMESKQILQMINVRFFMNKIIHKTMNVLN